MTKDTFSFVDVLNSIPIFGCTSHKSVPFTVRLSVPLSVKVGLFKYPNFRPAYGIIELLLLISYSLCNLLSGVVPAKERPGAN